MRARVFAALVPLLAGCGSDSPGGGTNFCYQAIARVPLAWGASFLALDGTTLYIGAFDNDAGYIDQFTIADVSNPFQPKALGAMTIDGLWGKIVPAGGRVYIGSGQVIDVTNPSSPSVMASIPGWGAMAPLGPYFVQSRGNAVVVVDLQNLATPTTVGMLAGSGLDDMAVVGNRAYVVRIPGVAEQESLLVVDLTNPTAPAQLGELPLPNAVFVAADEQHVFVGTVPGPCGPASMEGMFVIDAHDPAALVVIGHEPNDRNWGPYALVPNKVLSMDNIIDVSSPTSPHIIGRPLFPPNASGRTPSALTVAGSGTIGYWGTNDGVFVVDLACTTASK